MCAIAGIWCRDLNQLNLEAFKKALLLMEHRGPDATNSKQIGHVIMGANRLKIIDPPHGNQPMTSENENTLIFNGAIYNYPELAQRYQLNNTSDTEILSFVLAEKGELALDELRGMFAFAHYNSLKDEFLLARDRAGQKPLYYYHTKALFIFASELKSLIALMKSNGIEPEINKQAIYEYLCFSNISEPATIYENVFALEAGHYLRFQSGNLTLKRYWNYNYQPKIVDEKSEVLKRSGKLIAEAVKVRLRADVPIGLFLSGGWDSSVIAYEASQITRDISTFTVRYPFKSSQNEVAVARKTADAFGLPHKTIDVNLNPREALMSVVSVFDQPFADSSAIPNLAIAAEASKYVKVMLNGDGGDEQFGGYRRYALARYQRYLSVFRYLPINLVAGGNRRSMTGFLSRSLRNLNEDGLAAYLTSTTDMLQPGDTESIWKSSTGFNNELAGFSRHKIEELNALDQLMHYDRKLNLCSGILTKMDRASMVHSIEARSPFLDHQLFEYTSQLPDAYKINGFKRKHLLKALYQNKLPKDVVQGKKISFEAPLHQWLNKEFKPLIDELLVSKQAKIYEYLIYEEVQLILRHKKYAERNVDYIIYALLIFELWLQNNS